MHTVNHLRTEQQEVSVNDFSDAQLLVLVRTARATARKSANRTNKAPKGASGTGGSSGSGGSSSSGGSSPPVTPSASVRRPTVPTTWASKHTASKTGPPRTGPKEGRIASGHLFLLKMRVSTRDSTQRAVYNGHKRTHALKYQSVTTPDGIIAHLGGTYAGKMHDARILNESGLLDVLAVHLQGPHGAFYLYGDPAYGLSNHLVSPYKGAVVTEEQAAFNRSMSPVE